MKNSSITVYYNSLYNPQTKSGKDYGVPVNEIKLRKNYHLRRYKLWQLEDVKVNPLDSMLHRFKREVNDAMILSDLKKHEFYKSPLTEETWEEGWGKAQETEVGESPEKTSSKTGRLICLYLKKKQIEKKYDFTNWEKRLWFFKFDPFKKKKESPKNFLLEYILHKKSQTDYLTDDEINPIVENIVIEVFDQLGEPYQNFLVEKVFW